MSPRSHLELALGRGSLAAFLAAAGLLCACRAKNGDAGPVPYAMEPDRAPEHQAVPVVIRGDFRARVFTDYEDASATRVDTRFTAKLAGIALRDVHLMPDGTLSAIVPDTLAPGSYDLTVTGPDGREGTLQGAFRVLATSDLVASFRIDVVGPQQVMSPFTVTITALDGQGATVTEFNGSVTLSDTTGTVVPSTLGPFASGTWTGLLEVRAAADADVLTVSGQGSGTGASAPFAVYPAPVAGLQFASAPLTAQAGSCAGPVEVQVLDAYGYPTQTRDALDVSLTASEKVGLEVFSDGACQIPASALQLQAGAGSGQAWLHATRAGTFSLIAAAAAPIRAASQVETVIAGDAAGFAWDTIASPQAQEVPFSVVVRAVDAWNNPTSAFAGTATLSITPGTVPLTCASGCGTGLETAPFVSGVWSGSVIVGGPAGPGRQLVATAGSATGASAPFDVLGAADPSPPLASFTASPVVVTLPAASVTVDASASKDWQTATSALEVSWDCQGVATTAPGTSPWTAWTTTKTATCLFSNAGTYVIRLAVRDDTSPTPLISYASATVVVLASGSTDECIVDTAADEDDLGTISSSTTCATKGTDGKLSLAEAIRISNAHAGKQYITFSGPMTISGTGSYTISGAVEIRAPPGVILDGKSLSVDQSTSGVLISGLELKNQPSPIVLQNHSDVTLEDAWLHDMAGLQAGGSLTLRRVRMTGCTQTCIQLSQTDSSSSPDELQVIYSELRGSVAGVDGIQIARCNGGGSTVADIQSTVFTGFASAIHMFNTCTGPTLIRFDTFADNALAVVYGGGTGHELRDNIFVHQTTGTTDCTSTTVSCGHNLEYGGVVNYASDCVGRDPSDLATDPLFVFSLLGDYRLASGSPAVDVGESLGLDLNDAAPGLYFGSGPDLGGRESW